MSFSNDTYHAENPFDLRAYKKACHVFKAPASRLVFESARLESDLLRCPSVKKLKDDKPSEKPAEEPKEAPAEKNQEGTVDGTA